MQPLLETPFIGFMDVSDPDFEPADNIDELLDEAATGKRHSLAEAANPGPHDIMVRFAAGGQPVSFNLLEAGNDGIVMILRKIAQFSTAPAAGRRNKIGRNDPCPCGSGLKYKRCCGAAQHPPN